jgi:hypothetical protein
MIAPIYAATARASTANLNKSLKRDFIAKQTSLVM